MSPRLGSLLDNVSRAATLRRERSFLSAVSSASFCGSTTQLRFVARQPTWAGVRLAASLPTHQVTNSVAPGGAITGFQLQKRQSTMSRLTPLSGLTRAEAVMITTVCLLSRRAGTAMPSVTGNTPVGRTRRFSNERCSFPFLLRHSNDSTFNLF